MDDTNQAVILGFLKDATLGVFGAGHLGAAFAGALLAAGFPRARLLLCHQGRPETARRLETLGLADRVTDADDLSRRSRLVLYMVRPQAVAAIAGRALRADALCLSFLAGVTRETLPVTLPLSRRLRVMPCAPDAILAGQGIAALHPADNPVALALLALLRLRVFPLAREGDLHAFSALGPCLPIALTYWESLGRTAGDAELLELAAREGLADYAPLLAWARRVQPRGLTAEQRAHYVTQASTPGGVTEAILRAIDAGEPFPAALKRGVERSRALASAAAPTK